MNNGGSKKIQTTHEERGVLCPLLFTMFIDEIIKNNSNQSKKINIEYYKLNIEISE